MCRVTAVITKLHNITNKTYTLLHAPIKTLYDIPNMIKDNN